MRKKDVMRESKRREKEANDKADRVRRRVWSGEGSRTELFDAVDRASVARRRTEALRRHGFGDG